MTTYPTDITAVLFDMDETLIEHARTGYDICRDVYDAFPEQLGHVDAQDFIRTLGQKAGDLWRMMFDGVVSGDIARPYTFVNTLRSLDADESIAGALLDAFESILVESTTLARDAVSVMETLRAAGIRVGIVTNGYTGMQSRKIEHHALHDNADFVLISEAVGYHKPHPGIFEEALKRAGAAAETTLFVGDNLVNDISGALGAGIAAVLIDRDGRRTARLEEDSELPKPSYTVRSLEEVLKLVGLERARPGV